MAYRLLDVASPLLLPGVSSDDSVCEADSVCQMRASEHVACSDEPWSCTRYQQCATARNLTGHKPLL